MLYLFNIKLSHITLPLTSVLNLTIMWVYSSSLHCTRFPDSASETLLKWLLTVDPQGNLLYPMLPPQRTETLFCVHSWLRGLDW